MLAYLSAPFDSPDHLYEVKWDGTRCLLFLERGRLRLQNRRLRDITYRYPEFSHLSEVFPQDGVVLDGEIVVLKEGRPHFASLQEREHTRSKEKIRLLSRSLPATYIVFDLLYLGYKPLLNLPLIRRREYLQKLLPQDPYLVESEYVLNRGLDFFAAVCQRGLEGVMAKDIRSPYLPGQRSHYWLKFKPRGRRRCLIVGYIPSPKGGLRSLLVAEETEEGLRFRGRVGTGLKQEEEKLLLERLRRLPPGRPFPTIKIKDAHWVSPELSCLVSYQEITNKGRFRAPVFEGLVDETGLQAR